MERPKAKIQVLSTPEKLIRRAAEEFVYHTQKALDERGFMSVVLSGGSTPEGLYSLLSSKDNIYKQRIPWNKIHFFWGDERHVPPDHPGSNYRMVYEAMLSKLSIPDENVHRIKTENPDPEQAALEYENVLREFFRLETGHLPRFDLVFLGMGRDGHTASLFPNSEGLKDQKRFVVAPWVEKLNTYRVTLTPLVFNNAVCLIFLVSGVEKAKTLSSVLEGDYQPERYPAQLINPRNGRLLWLVDRIAARLLKEDI